MKTRLHLIRVLIFISIMTFYGCHDDDPRYIYLQNDSSEPIYYGLSYAYPDTNLNSIDQKPGYNGNISHKVQSGIETTLPAASFAFNSTMQLFIFDADRIENNPWDSIVKYSMILKRYEFTELDMRKDHWRISYK
jgi:hypothetical protein